MLELEHIIPVNYPEGHDGKPWCPQTKLIQIGADLVGKKLDPGTFCAEKMTDVHYSEGAIHYLEHATFSPKVSCLEVHIKLIHQMEIVKANIAEPDAEVAAAKIKFAKSVEEKVNIVEGMANNMKAYQERTDILKRWKNVIYETSVTHKGDEKNHHFRQFDSPNDIPLEEVIRKVEEYTAAFKKITGYEPFVFGGLGGAKNCNQSPRMHEYRGI